jgi:hypothetical protein
MNPTKGNMSTTTVLTLITPAANKLARMIENRDQGDPDDLERYYSPLSEIEVVCTTDEREDYEAEERGRQLTADVLDDREFVEFCHHLKYHFRLKLQ